MSNMWLWLGRTACKSSAKKNYIFTRRVNFFTTFSSSCYKKVYLFRVGVQLLASTHMPSQHSVMKISRRNSNFFNNKYFRSTRILLLLSVYELQKSCYPCNISSQFRIHIKKAPQVKSIFSLLLNYKNFSTFSSVHKKNISPKIQLEPQTLHNN